MPTFHHRDPGLVGLLGMAASPDSKGAFSSVAEDQRPHYGLIADGYHAHPASVTRASRMLSPELLFLPLATATPCIHAQPLG